MKNQSNISKILVFRLSSIGDIILTTALLRCLRTKFPNAQIDFVVKKQFASILKCVPFISNVVVLDKSKGFSGLRDMRKSLKQEHYDVALDIHKNWRSLYVCRTIGASQVLLFNKHVFRRWVLTTFHKNIYKEVRPVFLRFIDAAQSLGVVYDGNYTQLVVPQEIAKSVDAIFVDNNIDSTIPIIAVCVGASFTNKQWLPERFSKLISHIVNELHYQVILLGGKSEQSICDAILQENPKNVHSLSGKLDLSQSIAVLQRAKATVANDTGMLHASEAVGVPVVGIYGATAYPFGYYPILPQSIVAEVDLPCRPCTKMGKNYCPKGHFKCMKELTEEYVYSLLKKIIAL